jgi:hypothetical protein
MEVRPRFGDDVSKQEKVANISACSLCGYWSTFHSINISGADRSLFCLPTMADVHPIDLLSPDVPFIQQLSLSVFLSSSAPEVS